MIHIGIDLDVYEGVDLETALGLIQGTDEWRKFRCGFVTASRISEIMAKRKDGKPSAMRANYAADLIIERLTGRPNLGFTTADMQWGTDHEGEARDYYALISDVDVTQVGFVPHPKIARAGCSPDGLVVAKKHTVQFKCPKSATHIEQLLTEKVDPDYYKQIQWELASLPGYTGCDFISYDPRVEIKPQWRKWVPRNDEMIEEMEADVIKFLAEVETTIAKLQEKYGSVA